MGHVGGDRGCHGNLFTVSRMNLAAIFNNGRNGASGGSRLSIFSDERQHNFLGTTWYYHAGHAPNLWKRWLGYKVDNDGGEEEEPLVAGGVFPFPVHHDAYGHEVQHELDTWSDCFSVRSSEWPCACIKLTIEDSIEVVPDVKRVLKQRQIWRTGHGWLRAVYLGLEGDGGARA